MPPRTDSNRGQRATGGSARYGMAVVWGALVLLLSGLIGLAGPYLEEALPKGRSTQRLRTGKAVFSANFNGIFRTHAISLPKRKGERRIAYVGNSALARAHFAEALQAAVAAGDPTAQVFGLAWPGLNITGQLLFVRRAASYEIDELVWAISPIDCLAAPAVFTREAMPPELRLGTGPWEALRGFGLLARDNGSILLFNLLGALFPHVRYGSVLSEWAPRLPDWRPARLDRGSAAGNEFHPRAPAIPIASPLSHPPAIALRALEGVLPLLRARGTSLTILVMPHNDPDAWFGPGQLPAFVALLRSWAQANGARVIDLSRLLSEDAFWDGVHFHERFDMQVALALAEWLQSGGSR